MSFIKTSITLATFGLISALTACNTVQGAGQDLQAGGHAISKAAVQAKTGASENSQTKNPAVSKTTVEVKKTN
jgi:predicted small secreted protein